MSKIYAVTKGVYSDYHIIALTTDKRVAEGIKQKFTDGWGIPDIETYEDGEYILDAQCYFIKVSPDGEALEFYEANDEYAYNRGPEVNIDIDRNFYLYVITDKGEEVAKKIAFDKIAEFKAMYGVE